MEINVGVDGQPLRQARPQDPVLFFQIGNLTCQLLASCGRPQGKDRMQNRFHRVTVAMG